MSRLLNKLDSALHPWGRNLAERRAIHAKREAKAELVRVNEQRPSPLRLTDPIPSSNLGSQPLSAFLSRLPWEIRREIYEHVLGNRVIYLSHVSKRIAHQSIPLPASHTDDDDEKQQPDTRIYMPPPAPEIYWDSRPARIPSLHQFSTLPLSFLQTCRLVYTEALPLLYTANVFVCTSPLVPVYFHDLPLLRPTHLQYIRHLRLEWDYCTRPGVWRSRVYEPYDYATWVRFWELVADMKGLVSLGLQLRVMAQEEDLTVEAGWVKEMMKVKGLKAVEARVTWLLVGTGARQSAIEKALEKAWTR